MNTKTNNKNSKKRGKSKKQNRKKSNSEKKKKGKLKIDGFIAYQFTMQMAVVIKRHFPEFMKLLSGVSDYRKRPQYEVEELLMAVVCMFLFKRGSRNSMDNAMNKGSYAKNLEKMFDCSLPDLDTSDKLLQKLAPDELENIKQKLVSTLITRKVLHKFRFLNLYYVVAIDGTGVQSFKEEPYPECPYKTSKKDVRTWTASVLEAKIVCSNGFSISIATEWLKNPTDKEFDKQDCELKAFVRLADKLKSLYPRLPMVIAADGLYPNQTTFDICHKNEWRLIFTFKDGNLKSIWEEIELLKKIEGEEKKREYNADVSFQIIEDYSFINNLEYRKYKLNVVEVLVSKKHRKKGTKTEDHFAHITDIGITKNNCSLISHTGRMRWKIENEGFNEQKNGGYNLQHKYSRKSFNASQNYYQCLQIAHMINQLAHKTNRIKEMIKGNDTLKSFMEYTIAFIMCMELDDNILDGIIKARCQFRY